MLSFRAVVLWIHLAAIILWVGGLIIIPFVVVPVVRALGGDDARETVRRIVRRFQRLSRELVFVIVLTGVFNLINVGILIDFSFPAGYLWIAGTKFILLSVMAGNQAWYSLRLMPDRRSLATWSAAGNALLAAIALMLGLTLRLG